MKGWIALDIDGTITLDKYSVPKEVAAYLKELSLQGWRIALATGRPYAFAVRALSNFDFPYYFLVQNGTAAFRMPGAELLFERYLSPNSIALVEKAYEGMSSDFLIYAGYERGDVCFYRPHRFSEKALPYIRELQERQDEPWRPVDRFNPHEIGPFPLIKGFGSKSEMSIISQRLRGLDFQVAHIRDPHAESVDVLLITDKLASKGLSLTELCRLHGRGERVIAAGDDDNDQSLFDAADVRIAMPHAPLRLREKADIIAPPVAERGIIQALKQAVGNER